MSKLTATLTFIIALLLLGYAIVLPPTFAFRQMMKESIKPIDVYRGKTELQIKCVTVNNDTISCDSIVVWK